MLEVVGESGRSIRSIRNGDWVNFAFCYSGLDWSGMKRNGQERNGQERSFLNLNRNDIALVNLFVHSHLV